MPLLPNGKVDRKNLKPEPLYKDKKIVPTKNNPTSNSEIESIGAGGVSGEPVQDRSTEVIRYLSERSQNEFAIIGVGGVSSPESAKAKLDAGADLVQIYTGLIYEGPALIKKINKCLIQSS